MSAEVSQDISHVADIPNDDLEGDIGDEVSFQFIIRKQKGLQH